MDVLPIRCDDRSPHPAATPTKIAGLDAVRAVAALGVVLLHSGVAYLEHPMPGLVWPVRDAASPIVDFGFWTIELFIMPLFLLLAGFFAWQSLQRSGVSKLIKNRSARLLKPLVFAVVVILPMDLYCWVLGWVSEGLVPPVKLKSLKFDGGIDRDLWGLSHLWFLQYLFLYVIALACFATIRARLAPLQRFRPRVGTQIAMIIFLGSAVLLRHPEVVWGFQHDFLPFASKWIYSGLFFTLGAILAVHDPQLTGLKRWSWRLVGPAGATAIASVWLGQWHLAGGNQQLASMVLAVLTCSSAVLLTLSIVGLAAAWVQRTPAWVSYLAAASFWIYLLHHPLVGLVHIDLKWLLPGVSPLMKSVLAFAITSGFCVLTYEGLVRKTAFGRWLGFQWQPALAKKDRLESQSHSVDHSSGHNVDLIPPRRTAA